MKTQPNLAKALFVARFFRQGRQFKLPDAASESTTICQPLEVGAEAASEKLAKRFDLEFKLFAHSRETPLTTN